MKAIYLALFAALLLGACRKTSQLSPPPPNPDLSRQPKQPEITPAPVDSAMTLLLFCDNSDSVYLRRRFLRSYTARGQVNWIKDFGNEVLVAPAYQDGILYPGASYFNWLDTTLTKYVSYGKLYALDAATGNVKWAYLDSNIFATTPAIFDTTLMLPQYNSLYGISLNSGQQRWVAGVPNGLGNTPLIDGHRMFMSTAPLYTAYYSMVSMDIPTQSVDWITPVGYNGIDRVILSHGLVIFTTGSQHMIALDEVTGQVKWTIADQPYDSHLLVIDSVLIVPSVNYPASLYGFNVYTGQLRWKWNVATPTWRFNFLYQYGTTVYANGIGLEKQFLQGVNPMTGDSVSRSEFDILIDYHQPIYSGHSVYAVKNVLPGQTAVLVRLDAATFLPRDSVVLASWADFNWMHILTKSGKIL